jgi:membrane associated rhomboid family serine protease
VSEPDQPDSPSAAPEGVEPATCYRHPTREAHIRCTRCNRRICPDCMISASVGFQCPECVREGNAGVRTARTTFGGRVAGQAGTVTKILIGINVAVFLVQLVSVSFTNRFELMGLAVAQDGQYYRLLTAAFMHGGYLHIAFNMYALYLFGPPLEATFGRARFLTLYLLSALGGSAASYAFNTPIGASLGASGAVFGLLGAFLVVNRRLKRDNSGLLVLIGINLAIAFLPQFSNIDWHAHVGGLITGALVAAAMVYPPPEKRTVVQAAGCVVVLVLVIAVVAWRTAALT